MLTFELIAGVASILGLLFSLGTLIQASRASAAAKQARDAILIRTLADEFELVVLHINNAIQRLASRHRRRKSRCAKEKRLLLLTEKPPRLRLQSRTQITNRTVRHEVLSM